MKLLQHVTILDLSRVLACPFASMILAELGATVIKIEEPRHGDETRSFEPFVEKDGAAESAYYFACNRSKQSVTVNLRSPDGQAIIRDLARQADVFLENFPVGTLKRYGLGYPDIRAVNEQIVYVSCTGFGQSGPHAHRKGYDTIFQAMGGIMSLTGERGGPPVKPGLPFADLTSGLWVAIAILAGLSGRAASGRGTHIDFSMLDGQIALLTLAAARYFALGEVPPRLGTEHPGRVPSASFVCADGGYLHITASDQHWAPLCKALGLEDWGGDPDLQSNSGRLRRRDEVMAKAHRRVRRTPPRRDRRRARRGRRAARPDPLGRRDPHRRARRGPQAGRDLRPPARRRRPGAARALEARRLGRSCGAASAAPRRAHRDRARRAARPVARTDRAAQRGKGDMNFTTIQYAAADGVVTITLNRPEAATRSIVRCARS